MTDAEKELEEMAAEVHGVYCKQYMINNGKPYRTNGDYSLLDEPVKEYDRALVRWHKEKLAALVRRQQKQLEIAKKSLTALMRWLESVKKLETAEGLDASTLLCAHALSAMEEFDNVPNM
jgi:hypothetical protein